MSTEVQQLRGTTAENDTFIGKSGVLTIDTDKKDIRVHDGVKQGGYSILDRATQLQKAGGIINGDVTINDATGISYAILPNPAGEGNPTIRLGYTKKSENFCDLAFVGSSFNIYLRKFGDVARFYDDGTTRFSNTVFVQDSWWQPDGNIGGACWSGGSLYTHIENRCATYQNACVTDSRVVGWVELASSLYTWVHLPSGYFVSSYYQTDTPTCHFGGRQPQLFIANRGWFALGEW